MARKPDYPRETIRRSRWRKSHVFDADPPYRVLRVIIMCPSCSQWHGLKGHAVREDGEIEPALECKHCGYQAIITLEKWEAENG